MHLRQPLTVDDLRGKTLAELDVICSSILGLDPPDRSRECPCRLCRMERDLRPAFGPPSPPADWVLDRRDAMAERKRRWVCHLLLNLE